MRPGAVLGAALLFAPLRLAAQDLDMSHGGPIDITASDGLEWRQHEQQVIARGNAKAIRDSVTVTADRLIAWYRKKADTTTPGEGGKAGVPADAQGGTRGEGAEAGNKTTVSAGDGARPPAGDQAAQAGSGQGLLGDSDGGGNEIYRVQAEGNVHIYTQTDQAQGDKATYDLDQAVMVLTGRNLKLTTPSQVLSARDDMEYWAQKHMAVARGDAVVVTNDGRRLSADTVVAYTVPTTDQPKLGEKPAEARTRQPDAGARPTEAGAKQPAAAAAAATGAPEPRQVAAQEKPAIKGTPQPAPEDPLGASGKLEKVECYGNVVIRTVNDTVTGDRAVYVPDSGIARVAGKVRITRGQNQLAGAEADVNLKTGISRLLPSKGARVSGLLVPNDQTNQAITAPDGQPPAAPKGSMAPASTPPVATPVSPAAGKPK